VPPRLSTTERIRAQIDELFASQQDLGQILEQVARLSVRLVMQAAWRPRSASSWAVTATAAASGSVPGIATATPS
jgi:hypothetical protein